MSILLIYHIRHNCHIHFRPLLRHVPAVLVVKGGRVTGIVTRADLFKVVRG